MNIMLTILVIIKLLDKKRSHVVGLEETFILNCNKVHFVGQFFVGILSTIEF
jgi:hypothetical protein